MMIALVTGADGLVGNLSAIDVLFNCGAGWPRYWYGEMTIDAR